MSKSISRDEKMRRIEAAKAGGEGGGVDVVDEVDGAPVRVTRWGGRENFECGLCAYATLDGGVMVEHLRAAHGITNYELRMTNEEAEASAAGLAGDVVDEIEDKVM